ncbi:retinal pigment epithelial membrane protein [Drepanopeziza brunnea f. sp. 'multigermtubi' MB_m1]|uniref:Retinal pigment epithelial membrane protein n=1 Tax=Marssonina brunnea f. sp. multigermtubi (strain MB_m1) TaxID=1072389 RepID=K1WV77_MARBU|nr:retinal pigment epithelial membrane protein [Drepanopeziza brunnea f. sp. 'multigermtubi' MB_m1]EKD21545.1 retinal pigment epithelial membrane protein [Drepanopeziza brunnea f. sp. 'multigermtubi' MB_m1]
MTVVKEKQTRSARPHPYLHGNFAPIHRVLPLTPCSYTGSIPDELAGGEYVRNGGNPVTNEDLGRDAHWFDGDGMLSGVAFQRGADGSIRPAFVNQYILTDAYLSTVSSPSLRLPILPSIATLVNPASTLLRIILRIFRTLSLVFISHLPGSEQAIKKISVANTGILYHDGRALATCESGPPIRVSLPGLETVGWFDGGKAEGEPATENVPGDVFGGNGLLSFMKEWTTAHPRVDPLTNELILFHSTFFAPFVFYSIIPSSQNSSRFAQPSRLVNAAVPGIKSAKMMHDFGVSFAHTVIMDLPLSLDPRNLARNEPVVSYDPSGLSRFGVFPRRHPESVRWFETNPCCIFHTANTWDESAFNPLTKEIETIAVNMLACRLTSASLVFSAGDVAAPIPKPITSPRYAVEEEQCRLYYYRFLLSGSENIITHQFALTAMPFEFPSLRDDMSMSSTRYIYGCSVSDSTFGAALGRAVKIDSLVKVDATALIKQAEQDPPNAITGCVDMRSVAEILASDDPEDPIKIFKLPPGFYAQESRFVPRQNGKSEDDGWILSYVFDESQLDEAGNAGPGAKSELWIVDARKMKEVVCKVQLPQRVPYGLHGNWFSEPEILSQRPVETIRHLPIPKGKALAAVNREAHMVMDAWMVVRKWMLNILE